MSNPKPLTGKQIIEAANNGTEVLYSFTSFDIHRFRSEIRSVPMFTDDKEAITIDEDETGFWWKVTDLEGIGNFFFYLDEGTEAVYSADTQTAEEQLRERLAKFLHEDIWAHWMKYLFSTTVENDWDGQQAHEPDESMFYDDVQRWKRQMNTAYEDLHEEEKKSDQELADKLMKLLEEANND